MTDEFIFKVTPGRFPFLGNRDAAITVIREAKSHIPNSRQFISTLLTCSDRKMSLWYVVRYRITLGSDNLKTPVKGILGLVLCSP